MGKVNEAEGDMGGIGGGVVGAIVEAIKKGVSIGEYWPVNSFNEF